MSRTCTRAPEATNAIGDRASDPRAAGDDRHLSASSPLKPMSRFPWMCICPEPLRGPRPVDAERSDERARQRAAGRDGNRSGRGSAAGRSGSTRPRCAPTRRASEVRLASSCDTSARPTCLPLAAASTPMVSITAAVAARPNSPKSIPRHQEAGDHAVLLGDDQGGRRTDSPRRLVELMAVIGAAVVSLWRSDAHDGVEVGRGQRERTGMRSRDKASASSWLASL